MNLFMVLLLGACAAVALAVPVRLVGGRSKYQGRVEFYYLGHWGTICDDHWSIQDANVVCRMLGFPRASHAWKSAHFGQGSGYIILDDVQCRGYECSIAECQHLGWFTHNCGHHEDAGVTCVPHAIAARALNDDIEVLTDEKDKIEEDDFDFDVESKYQSYCRSGPRFRMCGAYTHNWSAKLCHPSGLMHHKRDNDVLLSAGEANTFLTSEGVNKRGLHEECCHEGCWWEEILEHC